MHLAALIIGIAMAMKKKGEPVAVLFGLYALAELSYLLYHIPVFNILFSHVVAEVLLLAGILYVGIKS